MITITKVVSRNFIADIAGKLQNFFGKNLTVYEEMIDKGMKQIEDEKKKRGIEFAWYQMQITQLNNDAIVITVYGDAKQ